MSDFYKIGTEESTALEGVGFYVISEAFEGTLVEKKMERGQLVAFFISDDNEYYEKDVEKYKVVCTDVLTRALQDIEIGTEVRIIYQGRQRKNDWHADYDVFNI